MQYNHVVKNTIASDVSLMYHILIALKRQLFTLVKVHRLIMKIIYLIILKMIVSDHYLTKMIKTKETRNKKQKIDKFVFNF